MAFFSSYISWLSLSREAIEASQNYRLARETILQMQELSEAAERISLLVYVPIQIPCLSAVLEDPETLARVFTDVPTIELDDAGFLQFRNETVTPELTRQNMDDQASLLADFAAENNIHFLDLTSTFQEEAGAAQNCTIRLTPIGTNAVMTWQLK